MGLEYKDNKPEKEKQDCRYCDLINRVKSKNIVHPSSPWWKGFIDSLHYFTKEDACDECESYLKSKIEQLEIEETIHIEDLYHR